MAASTPSEHAATELLRVALACGALAFGAFTLKSGRPSPYFMNIGALDSAAAAATLGRLLAARIAKLSPGGATLLGLPYKGIPLAALACAQLANTAGGFNYAYLRKEAKDHGEGGLLVGAAPAADRQLVLIDDVLTAGTAVRGAMATLTRLGLRPTRLLVAFDREERGTHGEQLARDEIERSLSLPVTSIATASDLLTVASATQATQIRSHLATYGAQAG